MTWDGNSNFISYSINNFVFGFLQIFQSNETDNFVIFSNNFDKFQRIVMTGSQKMNILAVLRKLYQR